MYEAQLDRDWQYILKDSGSKMLLVSKESIYNRVKDYTGSVGEVQSVLCFEAPEASEHSYAFEMSKTPYNESAIVPPHMPVADDVATVIYTSGTTGKPKGVELTHKNLCSDMLGVKSIFPQDVFDEEVRAMSFLPWAHVFGQTCELHLLLSNGSSIGIVPDVSKILESFQYVQPTLLMSVPLLFKKIYDTVHGRMRDSSPLRLGLFNYAIGVARRRNDLLNAGKRVPLTLRVQYGICDRVVLSKIRDVFGGKLKFAIAGGAATPLEVLRFFEDIDLPILEGYGLTETSPMISANSIERHVRALSFGALMKWKCKTML
jgi:long-chain acyl-CoA synthetase